MPINNFDTIGVKESCLPLSMTQQDLYAKYEKFWLEIWKSPSHQPLLVLIEKP